MRLRIPSCDSLTITSSAPAASAPWTAAFTSRVIRSRARSYSAVEVGPPPYSGGVTCTQLVTPHVPSMSAEMSTFIVISSLSRSVSASLLSLYHLAPLPSLVLCYDAQHLPRDGRRATTGEGDVTE